MKSANYNVGSRVKTKSLRCSANHADILILGGGGATEVHILYPPKTLTSQFLYPKEFHTSCKLIMAVML